MYALQYGALLYFSETERRLFNKDPDEILEIDHVPEYRPGYTFKLDAEKREIVYIEMNSAEPKDRTNFLKSSIDQI